MVPRALVYKQLDRIREAVQVVDDQTMWACDCSHCGGSTLDWIIDPDDAFQHSLATLAALRDAQFTIMEIESRGLNWQVPRFLGHWISA